MKSLTHGVLPDFKDYSKAFDEECPNGKFKFRNDKRLGDISLDKFELWTELLSAYWANHYGDEEAGIWASNVLYSLGFEWI